MEAPKFLAKRFPTAESSAALHQIKTPVGIRGNTLPSGIFDIVGSTMREISRSFGLFVTLSALMFDRPKKKSTRLPDASTSGCPDLHLSGERLK